MLIFLRDLKDIIREDVEDAISKGTTQRHVNLKKAIENGEDIIIANINSDTLYHRDDEALKVNG